MSTLATNDIPALMLDLGQAAKAAAAELAVASTDAKNTALRQAAQSLRDHSADILEAKNDRTQR
mgnify:CR=1 FL=1